MSEMVPMSDVIQGFWRLTEWNYSKEETNYMLHQLIDKGITAMDHADIYGSYQCETLFGEALSLTPEIRKEMHIITKCGIVLPSEMMGFNSHKYDYSEKHITASVNRSLKELHVDEIDTLLLHRPSPLMDPFEVAGTLRTLQQQGKVRQFGVSNFKYHQYVPFKEAMDNQNLIVAVNQLEISAAELENLEDGTLNWMLKDNVSIMAWSPLGGGKLFDRDNQLTAPVLDVLEEIAQKHLTTTDVIAYAWLYHMPYRIKPIVGSRSIARADIAVKAKNVELSDDEWFEIYKQRLGRDIL
ncbi:aldo/keto reductase [Macrococcus lamae]|uniref:Oxidoreductase n=1 Tax=Macrococcus lamae TaxID=198484 RepID=A0A4R6BVA9_9STAP|nr:aldo/keto reductase [Macrococcus lamae]TDM12214.1 oxidoreductase [Macrococcus lamae]